MKTTYYAGGDAVCCPVSYNDMPPIADGFDVELLTAAILDSQKGPTINRMRASLEESLQLGVRLLRISQGPAGNLIQAGPWCSTPSGFLA